MGDDDRRPPGAPTNAADAARWVDTCRTALAERDPERRARSFLAYLGEFPAGHANRRAAEAVEDLLHTLSGDARERVEGELRTLRQRVLPPVEPDTWKR
ncbi:MAG: hypothetical protein AAGH15_01140 [Myxococcota bacterium]